LLCILACAYIIAMTSPTIPYRQQPVATEEKFKMDGNTIPTWARLLFKGVKNKDKIKEGLKDLEDNPEIREHMTKGLLGQYLLNSYLPSNVDVDLQKKSINYKTKDNMDIGFSNRDDTNFLNLGWRF